MTQLASHDYALYLQSLLRARALQQLEPVRMLIMQHQSVLARFPHLQEEISVFLEPDTARDYGIVALSLRQGLAGLEKLLEVLDKARAEWGDDIDVPEIIAAAELYSTRVAQQSLQRVVAGLRQKRDRERRATEELNRRYQESMAEMKRVADEDLRRSLQDEAAPSLPVSSAPVRKPEQVEDARDRKRREQAEAQFTGWRKIGRTGEVLEADSERWSAVVDEARGLMWAVNWYAEDRFPNRGDLTWYNPDRATNGGNPGNPNRGENTHEWLIRVNQAGWCGFKDWRLPSAEELRTLLTDSVHTYYHIREDVFSDMGGLGSRFWTSTPDPESKGSAMGVYFAYGQVGSALKTYTLFVRLVRDADKADRSRHV